MKEFVNKNKVLVVGIIALVIVLSLVIIINTTNKKLGKDTEYNNSYKPNYDEELKLGDVLFNSTDVNYDNTDSGLSSTTVKEAIDELYDTILQKECAPGWVKQNASSKYYECILPPICKAVRNASDLRTDTCAYTNTAGSSEFCYGDGYYASGNKGTTTIIYGSVWDGVSALKAGDAFICDVNGDGDYDAETEWFYYVSPYFNTDTRTFDDTTGYATLNYYGFYNNGSPSNVKANYHSSNNWHGPVEALNHLPTTTSWSNIKLKTTTRAILAERTSTHNATSTSGGTLPTAFSYAGRAARLLTVQETLQGCGLSSAGSYGLRELTKKCRFLFDQTAYATSSRLIYGQYFETPYLSDNHSVWYAQSRSMWFYFGSAYVNGNGGGYGIRPTIDVPYSRIEY